MPKQATKKSQKSRKENWAGMNWIRQSKRLAIYLRDGLSCAYCGETVEQGAQLTLDHVKPHSKGGSNSESNLVTCCHRCNARRQDRPVAQWARIVAEYNGVNCSAEDIVRHVSNCRRRALPKKEAKRLVARRGSAAKAIEHLSA